MDKVWPRITHHANGTMMGTDNRKDEDVNVLGWRVVGETGEQNFLLLFSGYVWYEPNMPRCQIQAS